MTEDRRGPLEIKWVHNKCGQLSIGGVAWGAVEWSEKRQDKRPCAVWGRW